jgi:hypothetical protein
VIVPPIKTWTAARKLRLILIPRALHGFCIWAAKWSPRAHTRCIHGGHHGVSTMETRPMPLSISLNSPSALGVGSFTFKLLIALTLVTTADLTFDGGGRFGSASAGFAALWLVGLWLSRPTIRAHSGASASFAFAWAMAVALFEDPSALAALLFLCGALLTGLLPRAARFGEAARWARRLALTTPALVATPIRDLMTWLRARRRGRGVAIAAIATTLALPVGGAVLFITLFAQANPVIAGWLASYRDGLSNLSVSGTRVAFWLTAAVLVWASLRNVRTPRFRSVATPGGIPAALPGVTEASVRLSLILFNALFLVENVLDLVFLWSGAPLPEGVTLAEYAHRGAYPLIVTALLAGAFVLVALRPGAPAADDVLIRRLVYLWIAQNIFLVASSALRTIDYVEAYSLTRLRLAALIWMALVAAGLALICWRILKNKSSAWLINANAVALAATLSACAFIDLGEITARWNVRHATGTGKTMRYPDIQYLELLGPSALRAFVDFERDAASEPVRAQVTEARVRIENALATRQADWRSWTWRGARRLAATRSAGAPASSPSQPEPAGE